MCLLHNNKVLLKKKKKLIVDPIQENGGKKLGVYFAYINLQLLK